MSVAAVVVIALVVSGAVAVSHGVPIWVLVAGAFVGAVAGIGGGRLILRLLLPEPAPDSTTSTIDLRLDDDRIDCTTKSERFGSGASVVRGGGTRRGPDRSGC